MSDKTAVPPSVLWAQRKNLIYLTFGIECKTPNVKIEKDSVHFEGTDAADKKKYEVTIPLYSTVKPNDSTYDSKGRSTVMVLYKEDCEAPYWPSLTKDKKKPPYLKIDFNRWLDEDEEGGDGEPSPIDLSEMLSMMGSKGGAHDKASLEDLESDSDDENLPDLE